MKASGRSPAPPLPLPPPRPSAPAGLPSARTGSAATAPPPKGRGRGGGPSFRLEIRRPSKWAKQLNETWGTSELGVNLRALSRTWHSRTGLLSFRATSLARPVQSPCAETLRAGSTGSPKEPPLGVKPIRKSARNPEDELLGMPQRFRKSFQRSFGKHVV